jgi:hypothetical protein
LNAEDAKVSQKTQKRKYQKLQKKQPDFDAQLKAIS